MRFDGLIVAVASPVGDEVVPARAQMAATLGFHIILACLGIALPAIVLLAEFIGLRRPDEVALVLARRWSQAMGVLVAVGAVTGTVLSFEMGLLWPGLMRAYGAVLGLPVVWLVHLCFDVMVGLGFLLLLAGLWALYAWWRHRRLPSQRLFWLLGTVSGLAAIVAMECGWVVTEVGRQPIPGSHHRRRQRGRARCCARRPLPHRPRCTTSIARGPGTGGLIVGAPWDPPVASASRLPVSRRVLHVRLVCAYSGSGPGSGTAGPIGNP